MRDLLKGTGLAVVVLAILLLPVVLSDWVNQFAAAFVLGVYATGFLWWVASWR